jgi:glycosyltransferase involved in cell wall biosynthesis
MKFAFVITNLAGGGAEKAIIKLADGLQDRGHEVHFVLLENRVDYPPPPGCALHVVTPKGGRVGGGLLGKRVAAWRLGKLMRRLAAERSFDLIVSTLPYADEVALRAGLPGHWCRIANTLSGEIDALAQRNPGKAARRRARYRKLYAPAQLIAVSDGVADDLRQRLGLATTRIERIYNPFDFAAIRAEAQTPATLPDAPFIVHIGRLARQKRHDLLFAAYKKADLPQRLVLLTLPDPKLDALIADYGLQDRVVVAGFQANPYPWLAKAELLVLCSDHEGLPNVLIEALACATRVVSTDCPSGPSEILSGELARHLAPCDDAAALAQAMRDALAEPRPSAAAVTAALAPFAADTVVGRYEQLARAR